MIYKYSTHKTLLIIYLQFLLQNVLDNHNIICYYINVLQKHIQKREVVITNTYKKLRKNENLTQEQLAKILGIKRENISKWENEVTVPNRENLVKIADYFKITVDELLGRYPGDTA